MSEEQQHNASNEHPLLPSIPNPFAIGIPTFLAAGAIDLLAHLGPTGLLIGGIAAIVAARHTGDLVEQVRGLLPVSLKAQEEARPQVDGKRSLLDRALGRFPEPAGEEQATEAFLSPKDDEVEGQRDDDLFLTDAQVNEPSIVRLSIESIINHIERNSYTLYIGRSLTRPRNPAVCINFYKRHLKLIGASQHGKSSMAAAILEAIIRTHDPEKVLIALLDLENKTSRLFADAPHVAEMLIDDQPVLLHARSYEQVLEHLLHISALIDYRYALPESELDGQPVLIVYLEEFVDLKDYFKQRANAATDKAEKEQANKDYEHLVYCIKKIAARGLKVFVQLLMCAQVDYRDDDLQEALVNVTSGMSFCVRVSAASAAGFYRTDLLKRNAQEDKVGQAVVEMPDCKDLVFAPEYDLKMRLRALDKKDEHSIERCASERGRSAPFVTAQGYSAAIRYRENGEPMTSVMPSAAATQPPMATPVTAAQPMIRSSRYDRVLAAYNAGHTSSRQLGQALGVSKDKANDLLNEMERLGLISRRPSSGRIDDLMTRGEHQCADDASVTAAETVVGRQDG